MQLHLPDVQQNFAVNGQKEELIESQMEKMFCMLSGDLVVTKE